MKTTNEPFFQHFYVCNELLSFCLFSIYIYNKHIKKWVVFMTYLYLISYTLLYIVLSLTMLAAAAKLLQSCPTLCDPIDGSPSGSPVPGILQARTLEWAAISFSSAWKWKVKVKSLSRVRLFATPWTAAYQAPPPMRFSRQELIWYNYSWIPHLPKSHVNLNLYSGVRHLPFPFLLALIL